MELAAALIVLAGSAAGLALRKHLGAKTRRALLVAGSTALFLGFATLKFAFSGWIPAWSAAGLALGSFGLAILILPLALAATVASMVKQRS